MVLLIVSVSLKLLLLLLTVSILIPETHAARFAVTGPVLTLTLKDEDSGASSDESKWIDIGSLKPSALWSLSSSDPPLPNWLPALKSCRATIGYRYHDMKQRPAFLEADAQFRTDLVDVQVQPTYEWKSGRASVVMQMTKGASYVVGRFANRGRNLVEYMRASYLLNLPFAPVGAVRVTPSFDFVSAYPACTLESVTASGRTKAVLNLQYQDPSLTVVHALDERNTIAPEISLHTAKILYQWTVQLDSGSIKTKVDPTSAIHVSWTDRAMNGKWVTDFSLPLKGTTVAALAANVRVRRQFTF